jgi:hydrogenase/urease accessory protein HupE
VIRIVAACLVFLVLAVVGRHAQAHEIRPAYFEIAQAGDAQYTVTWKQPVVGDMALPLAPRLSNGWIDGPPGDAFATPGFLIKTWTVDSAAPLAGATLSIGGLAQTHLDVLAVVRLKDGVVHQVILTPDHSSATLDAGGPTGLPVPAYLRLGIEHILTGPDHLSFVFGLLLLIGLRWELLKAITAFTVAHSITLAASALNLVRPHPPVIETLVALSIVFLAVELLRPAERMTLARRAPWIIAFVFGLMHGFAFAGALADVGLPQGAIPMALFLFNLGVEIGQLIFVAAAIVAMQACGVLATRLDSQWRPALRAVPAYGIGIFAAYLFIDRIAAVFTTPV